MSQPQSSTAVTPAPEKYLIAFVIQGDDVFKITADNIVHTTGTANGPAFDAIAKLKAAAALLELTNRHKERPDELRQMARELAGEGMKLMARASSAIRSAPPVAASPEPEKEADTEEAERMEPAQASFAELDRVPEENSSNRAFAPQVAAIHVAAPIVVAREERPPSTTGPAPVPRSDEGSGEPGTLPYNPKIALISG